MEKVLKVSWKEFDSLVDKLAAQIKASTIKPKYIYPIARGGLPVACALSHRLKGIPITYTPNENFVLFVDDISDEGKTLSYYSTLSLCYATATLHIKRGTIFKPDFYAREIEDREIWVVYPWELEGELHKKGAKLKKKDGIIESILHKRLGI